MLEDAYEDVREAVSAKILHTNPTMVNVKSVKILGGLAAATGAFPVIGERVPQYPRRRHLGGGDTDRGLVPRLRSRCPSK